MGEVKRHICDACEHEFATHNTLLIHIERCKVIKQQNYENEIRSKQEEVKSEMVKEQDKIKMEMIKRQEEANLLISERDKQIDLLQQKIREIERLSLDRETEYECKTEKILQDHQQQMKDLEQKFRY